MEARAGPGENIELGNLWSGGMMDATAGQISVVIVSYNTREMTLKCLNRLYESLDGGGAAEVFVVDNGSADRSVEAIQAAFPLAHVIANRRNLGFGAANNQAMRLAKRDYFLLLNSDAFPQPGAIAALLEYMRSHPNTGIVGPKLLNADRSLQRSCYRFPSPWRATCEYLLLTSLLPNHPLFGDFRSWEHDRAREVDMVIGACMLVRKSAVDKVGMFDEDFFLYSEETDLCKRLKNTGWEVAFTPAAEVIHLNGASGKTQSDRVFTEFHRGQERFIRKHHGAVGLAWYRIMVVSGSILRMSAFGLGGLIVSGKRSDLFATAGMWVRILCWTVGRRTPGLSEFQQGEQNQLGGGLV